MLSLAEARHHVLDRISPLTEVQVSLDDAVGTALSRPIVSADTVPPFDNSAVDGVAVRASDLASAPATFTVVDRILAGSVSSVEVGPGHASKIMTGAPMPEGADAVAMVEWCTFDGDSVTVDHSVEPGTHVRPAGDDMNVGDRVLEPGTTVTPAIVGLLATLGEADPWVVRRPVVGVFSTGDELVPATERPGPGQIRDSNRVALCGMVRRAGFEAVDLGLIGDDHAAIADAITSGASRCDALVTSGGVSMGEVDLVRVVLDELGDMRWMQIAIKPAKPFAFGTVTSEGREVPVFGLPGNPVSSLVSFELLARPALNALGGHARLHPPKLRAPAGTDMARRSDGKTHFVRVRFDGDAVVPAGGQGSHQMSAMATADALAVLPDGEGVMAGNSVELILLG